MSRYLNKWGAVTMAQDYACVAKSKAIYDYLYNPDGVSWRQRALLVGTDTEMYENIVETKKEMDPLLNDEFYMIMEIENICMSPESLEDQFKRARDELRKFKQRKQRIMDSLQEIEYQEYELETPTPQSYEKIDVSTPVKKFDYYETEKPMRVVREEIISSPEYSDAELSESDDEITTESVKSDGEDMVSVVEEILSKKKSRESSDDLDYKISEEWKKFNIYTSYFDQNKRVKLLRDWNNILTETILPMLDKKGLQRKYFPLTYEVLDYLTEKFKVRSAEGGYRHKHRFTRCKKHTHCRHCGKRHH